MVQKYIASQHERNKNKSILPPSFGKWSQYVLSRILYNRKLQEKNHEFKGKEMFPNGYPNCLTGEAWDAYANNPFDFSTRKEFLCTISLSCIDKKKDTKITPPYALALENVTTDVGLISSPGQRKIDARHYNESLLTPGIEYHMTSKIQNSLLNDHYRNPFEVGIINFITRFGKLYANNSASQNSWSI
jgi:hypothetical protein